MPSYTLSRQRALVGVEDLRRAMRGRAGQDAPRRIPAPEPRTVRRLRAHSARRHCHVNSVASARPVL